MMDDALVSLIAANVAFVGTHIALSHPLRAPLVRALGERGFLAVYSLVATAALVWIVIAFRAVGPGGPVLWNGLGDGMWVIASLLTIVALALATAGVRGNPAMVGADPGKAAASAGATGVYAVTRHPLMWGFAIWALAHILVSPNPRTLVTAGSMAFLALVGAHLQDRKKERIAGAAWRDWEARTSFAPRLSRLGAIGGVNWIVALALWLLLTWAHGPAGVPPAGIWRWI